MGFNSSERLASIEIGVSAASVLAGTGLSHITRLVHAGGSNLSTFVTTAVSMIGQMVDLGPGLGQISAMSLNNKGFSGISTVLSGFKFSYVYSVAIANLSAINGELKIAVSNGAAGGGFSVALTAALGITRGTEAKDNIGNIQTAGVTTLKGAMALLGFCSVEKSAGRASLSLNLLIFRAVWKGNVCTLYCGACVWHKWAFVVVLCGLHAMQWVRVD